MIYSLVFSLVPGVFGNQQQQHLGMIKAMLTSSLADSGNPPVQALAVKATAAFILLHDNEPNIQRNFADLLQPFLQVLSYPHVATYLSVKNHDVTVQKSVEPRFTTLNPVAYSRVECILQLCTEYVTWNIYLGCHFFTNEQLQ